MPAGCSQLPNFRYATHSLITPSPTLTHPHIPSHPHTHTPPTHPHTPSHTPTTPHTFTLLTHTPSPILTLLTHPHIPSPTLTLLTPPNTPHHPHTPLPTHTLTHPHTPHTLHTLHTHTLTDLPLQLNHAKFEFNGATGYILKPWVMLTEKTRGGAFNPFTQSKLEDIVPAKLSIKVRHGLVVGGGL